MASVPTTMINAVDSDDPLQDLPNFFQMQAQVDIVDHVGTFLKMSTKQDPFVAKDNLSHAANYSDDIVAHLPTFLEMATNEDPIDDLAMFLDRAWRWSVPHYHVHDPPLTRSHRASSQRLIGPQGTFYLFSEFPSKIRTMIWEECIPTHVHLIAERVYERPEAEAYIHPYQENNVIDGGQINGQIGRANPYHSRHCVPGYPATSGHQKLPVIAQVNQEARAFALQHKSKRYNLAFVHRDMNDQMDRVEESPVWLNKKDTVLINTYNIPAARLPTGAVFEIGFGHVDIRTDRLLGMVTRNHIQVAIFADALIHGPPNLYHALTQTDRVDVVVGVLRFDGMSDNEAAVTGLFGKFGEEPMALIPAKNSLLLRKLFIAHGAFRPQCAAEYLDPNLIDYLPFLPEDYQSWFIRRRPSDFNAYREVMRGLARHTMIICQHEIESRGFAGQQWEVRRQWEYEVNSTFKNTFAPVFLIHRCRNPVLIEAPELHG